MKKRIIRFALFFLILCIPAFQSTYSQDVPEFFIEGDWVYQDNGKGWTISAYSGNAADVEIPSRFNGIFVTQLSAELFSNNLRLESVVIPTNITSIGKNAFQGCVSLKKVTLPYLITSIAEGTFKGCVSLEAIILPGTLTGIGKEAFSGCESLKEIVIPHKVSSIGEAAFENCTSLDSVLLATSRLSTVQANAFHNTPWLDNKTDEFVWIGQKVLLKYNGNEREVVLPYGTVMISNVFQDNRTAEKVVIPETVRRIGQNAFKNAVNLHTVNIPQYVTTIDSGAFEGCHSLENIELPKLITGIGSNAFNGCERLKQLVFPPKVKNIQSRVAGDCPKLTDVWLPANITSFNKNAFLGSDLVMLHTAPDSAAQALLDSYGIPQVPYVMKEGDYFYSDTGHGVTIVKYTGSRAEVEVPQNIGGGHVTEIGPGAFQGSCVRRIILPSGVITIGSGAFSYMNFLEYIKLPVGLKNIGENAFAGTRLSAVLLPNRISETGSHSFGPAAMICAKSGSDTERLLSDLGYAVHSPDSCTEGIEISADFWGYNGSAADDPADGDLPFFGIGPEDLEIIQIPDGMTRVTGDLISGTKENVFLAVPDSVAEIDPLIFEGKNITLFGNAGTYAETFAAENGIKFIVRVNTRVIN